MAMSAEDRNGNVSTDEECTGCPPREHSFDRLTKGLATATLSRRGALRLLAGALFGGALASAPGVGRIAGNSGEAQAQAACAGSGASCTADNQCCQGNTCISGFCCPNLRTCAGGCCAAGASCSGRACGCTTAGQTACPSDTDPFGACTDLQTDENNCGQCGTQCVSGQECVAGECKCTRTSCPSGCCTTAEAGGTCNAGNTIAFCGGNGNICEACTTNVPNAQATCNNQTCGFECLPTHPNLCGTGTSQKCVNFQTDVENCGECDRACPAPANATATCALGQCDFVCNAGFTRIGDSCCATT